MFSIVNKLKEARDQKGITISKASEDTRISKKFLESLEKEDYKIFPAEVYLKGFLRIYAKYLGLNPEEILDDYKKSKED
jgi:cytoskeleton protein RodZ